MTYATPTIAAITAAIAVPSLVILYFLKLRRRSVEISSTLLWRKAVQDLQANAPFQRLRKNILLLLQLLALAAALFAIAQPQKKVGEATSTRHVIMIDRSASMGTKDGGGGKTRLEAAKKTAIDQVDSLDEGDIFGAAAHEAMVIAFDSTAEVVQRFTTDKAKLRSAIESIQQTDAPGSIKEAFQLAQAHRPKVSATPTDTPPDSSADTSADGPQDEPPASILAGPPQTFHLYTDGRISDLDTFLPASQDSVVYHTTGDPDSADVGITGLRAERAYDHPEHLTIFVGLQNTFPTQVTPDVELSLDGAPSAIRSATIAAPTARTGIVQSNDSADQVQSVVRAEPGKGGVVFELDMPRGSIATVRLRGQPDPFPTDDQGELVIPPASQTSVAVVTKGNLFLAEALAGLPLAELDTLTPDEFRAQVDSGQAEKYDVVVLDGMLPPNTPEGRALAPGRWLILGAIPGSPEGLVDKGEGGYGQFVDWRRDHPVLQGLTLDPVRIGDARQIEIPDTSAARSLAETQFGPGIVEFVTAEARAIGVLFDVADSNWPFDVSFVVFLASAIDYLDAATASDAGRLAVRPGEILTERLPLGATDASLEDPDGDRVPLAPAADGRISWGPVRRTGLLTLRWNGETGPADTVQDGKATRFVASNLLDPYESDIAPEDSVALASQIVAAASQKETAIRHYWRWLLLAALAVIMLEWYIYNRKVQI
ncbi:MAG: VWA domain-containing protein [Phycisphaeraceae bacterium]|nr:MAG: VWA domain-containing protein [Phycisphaeraceae bacterium]